MELVSVPDNINASVDITEEIMHSERTELILEADISIKLLEHERKKGGRKLEELKNVFEIDSNTSVENINDNDNSSEGITRTSEWKSRTKDITDETEVVEKNTSKDGEEDRLPDGGWGWVVVFGASLILVLVDTMGQCFGVVFSRFLLDLETSTATTAWIFNLFSFIWCLTGPPLGPLINEFGWRSLTFIGSILLATATISSAFVTSASVLFFTYSLLAGTGCGIISNISYMIVPHYFKKRRGLANGIIMAWDCGGQLIGPPLIHILQEEYTYKGATLILGGIILNCFIGAAVFHPVEWHLKPQVFKISKIDETQELMYNTPCKFLSGQESPTESHLKTFLRLFKSTLKELLILRSAKAIIIAMGASFIFNGYLNFLAIVPFTMQEAGYSLKDAATCISVSAICNMITRVIISSLSDNKMFNFQISMMIGSLVISGTMVAFTLLQDLTMMRIVMGVWGCGVGTFMSIFNLVMVHYMGLNNLMPMLGASMLCIAVGYLTVGPFAGYVRDATESYAVCIWVLAGVVFLSFILWLFMPLAMAYDLRREKKKNENIGKSRISHDDA